jgi:hypothetical protein
MHAEDDRYAKLFLFTEKEVEILCNNHGEVRSHFKDLLFFKFNLSIVNCRIASTAL